jgi:hypothetical protein
MCWYGKTGGQVDEKREYRGIEESSERIPQ